MALDHNGGVILQIPGMLTPAELETLRAELRRAPFADRTATAGHIAREVKKNLQLPPGAEADRKCAPIVLEALRPNPVFFSAALLFRAWLARRRILFEFDLVLGAMRRQKLPPAPEVSSLTATYHNLLRLWSET